MDESDDDFKELCASFFQRVKKNGTKEVSGERKTLKASNSTQIRSKLKKTKQSAINSKTVQGTVEKKPKSGIQAPRTKKQVTTKLQESEPALPVNGEGGVLVSAPDQPVLWERAQSIQTAVSSPSKYRPRAADLAVQRMQQFKRADPERLTHASKECALMAALEENVPKSPQEETVTENGYEPGLPATNSDAAVALALQQEFGRESASTCDNGLEERGLFFCQMCQKNLSAMNATRREQHVNRCLDEAEKVPESSVPQIPECPICGKPFLTSKSRASHLKRCAVKMEVRPQLLLQAVRLQTAQPEVGSSPPAPSFSNHAGGLKRKGTTSKKEPQKRRKVNKPEAPSEDLLVAMALSRSEMEQSLAVPALRLESASSEMIRFGAEKKHRKKKPLLSLPQLLVQDSETTGRQIEDRVAQLLSEEMEMLSTPPLPPSKIFKEEFQEAGWRLQVPKGKQNFLWESSALTGTWAVESFYTEGLVPPIVPQQSAKESELPLELSKHPQPSIQRPPALHGSPPAGCSPRDPSLSASQREHQALQDLMDLAEEGLGAGPWPRSSGGPADETPGGLDLMPSSLPLTGFVLTPKEKPPERSGHASLSLGLLIADFSTMVNNPHLSDVQFQMDSGEVLYAHKCVLYARCPLLIQHINSEGFSAFEDGDQTQRVLLSNVRAEAACAFLYYLYTADTDLPPDLAPDLRSLALRFGVNDLVHLCEQVPIVTDLEGEQEEKEDKNCESRAENFQELLRSVWVDEEEEAETLLKSESHEEDREKVNEAEMEEIYEFAATQRKLLQGGGVTDTDEDPGQLRENSSVVGPTLAASNKKLEKAEQRESPWLERDETPGSWENARHSLLLLQDQHSDDAGKAETHEQEAPKEAPGHLSFCSPFGGCLAGRKDDFLLHPVKVREGEQFFTATQGEFSERFQITSNHELQNGTIREWRAELVRPPTPQQASPPNPSCLLRQSPGGRSPSQSQFHLHDASTSSLSTPQSHSGVSQVASPSPLSPVVPSKQRRDNSILTSLKESGHRKGKRCSSMLECKNTSVLISPEKSQPIDLTQSKPDHLSSGSQDPPSRVNKEVEIILLLDSDEELELAQAKTKSASHDPPEERNILEVSPKSSELFSVIDVDADQEYYQSPLRREVKLQPEEEEGQLENQVALGNRRTPWLFCNQDSSPAEDSTTTSWLVPATPLDSRNRDCSSQTRVTSLRMRTPPGEMARPVPRASFEHRAVQEAAHRFSPSTPGTSDSGRQAYRSPRHHTLPSALGPRCDFTRRHQKLSPPEPCLPNQAAASEVVEVRDSEDEEGVTSHQVNSDPLVPGDDCYWNIEPLSPIPIDHLSLNRTGPLSTSSPSSRLQEAPDGGACRSPGLLGTTPIRGSCAAQRGSQEHPAWDSSPGSSRLSFPNPVLWDEWDGEGQRSPESPAAAQTPRARVQKPEGPETPKGARRKKNLPPKVPVTPMPQYSIMETPVLKKELDRFGVRPLPKRQMVLKLKEIFQYTHQTLESDSEDEIQSSQVPLEVPCSQTLATKTYKPSRAGGHTQIKGTVGPGTQSSKGSTKTKGPQPRKQQPSESIPHPSRSSASELPPGPDGDAQLSASQESVATSVDSSDSSFSLQSSSSCELGAAFESAGEDEGEEEAAIPAADTEEAVRRYVRSKPALYRKVLMYQPLELAELQAELKRDGIRVATAKLLDILDTHCITFTTAAARKEKLERKGQQRVGRKKGERN
uniref:Structure-specific endonuclease subunit SLX4 n=1 Tax=Castor canadensis TaxID=51338 RepID=A0A8B7U367_CASCN|nr:structure-specific endonuclease subunit SLX4 [Castor canadensis]